MSTKLTRVMVTLTDEELKDVDELIDLGKYRSRSDLGRIAIRQLLYKD